MNKNKFYVTTPIYYVTAAPHLGSLYSTLLADVATRYNSLMGKEVFFLTGTDEHGQKVAEAAKKAGKEPKEFVDGFIESYTNMWQLYNIKYTKFIRTTDNYHVHGVQRWLADLIAKGDIYKDIYTGWYCTPCETFVTQKDQLSGDGELNGLLPKEVICPSCERLTNQISEECYFFRLSAYQNRLIEFFDQHPDFITPKERMNEVIAFVKEGLKDLSISRTTVSWGISFPGDSKHVTYVWADALNNYITAIGYGDDSRQKELDFWWPADMQILGKDIVRFHAIYWPAFLMASGMAMPHKLLVHGWIKVGDKKMSKSLGNAVDPKSLANEYGVDQIRYYLTRKMAITQDSEFSISDIEQSINSELADDFGNLLNRCSTLAEKYNYTTINASIAWSPEAIKLKKECDGMIREALKFAEQGYFYRSVNRIWEYINRINAYFHAGQPWKEAVTDTARFQEIIAATIYSLRAVAVMLWPVMPSKMEMLLGSLGQQISSTIRAADITNWTDRLTIRKIETIFKKNERTMEKKIATTVAPEVSVEPHCITIDDFAKVDLRVGLIVECEIVEKSEKLLKLQVDFGDFGKRQIFSGLRKYLTPQDLIGKQGIFVVNFKPRNMMGMLSEGMMLTAESGEKVILLTPSMPALAGSKIK